MIRNSKVQLAAVLLAGSVLGYVAASTRSTRQAEAASSARPQAEKRDLSQIPQTQLTGQTEKPDCCELSRHNLVAAQNQVALGNATKDGKKPNIVFIMGDDIGVWNIGAYHRGMMAGRTPNLDRLAAEGMLFT